MSADGGSVAQDRHGIDLEEAVGVVEAAHDERRRRRRRR
jgi:hypothetical protein